VNVRSVTIRTLSSILLIAFFMAEAQQKPAHSLKTYLSPGCGFSFTYPASWIVVRKSIPTHSQSVPECDIRLLFRAKGKKSHSVSVSIEEKELNEVAENQGFEKLDKGWSYHGIMEQSASQISGDGWNGLSINYPVRCFGGPLQGYQGIGEGLIAVASSGKRTLIIDGGECNSSDPEAFLWVIKSLKFFPTV
jgi:hypothetical protein